MLRVVTSGGRVGHIVDSVTAADGDRIIVTVCGKTHREYEVRADNDADACVTCEKKVFGSNEPEPEPEPKKAPVRKTLVKTDNPVEEEEN